MNVSFFHRLLMIGAYLFVFFKEKNFDPKDFMNAAVRSGGILTASSSSLPMYPVYNALLYEEFLL